MKGTCKTEFVNSIKNGVALVDFNASWCTPCRIQSPIISNLMKRFEGRVKITELNIDENRETAFQLGIHSIPTIIIFRNGQEIKRLIGLQSEDELIMAIDMVLR